MFDSSIRLHAPLTSLVHALPIPPSHPTRRFAKLEDEVRNIEDQLADYSQRLSLLQQQQAALRALNQPRAKDLMDEEEETEGSVVDTKTARADVAKRALEGGCGWRMPIDLLSFIGGIISRSIGSPTPQVLLYVVITITCSAFRFMHRRRCMPVDLTAPSLHLTAPPLCLYLQAPPATTKKHAP